MPKESRDNLKLRAAKITKALMKKYPNARTALRHINPLELLIATILSAQCTDKRVNSVTKDLFAKYKTLHHYANAPQAALEEKIRSTGFFRNKARNIRAACAIIISDFGGSVPKTMDQLLSLPGVARKTANVVLGNAFGRNEGIAVDTHVKRLSGRLALSKEKTPEKIERDLMELVPQEQWATFSHLLIFHGRACCTARKPNCPGCLINKLCPSAFKA
ncbi:MAG: endonuclease III [Phycisphaerae bacterium]|jgi:endonuclease-3|nr:endonuclease III [Phycisphaerae bacterium]MDP7636860.1 endonuclease III [Phycisphaerae bacterium]